MITVKRFTASWCAPCKALAPVFKGLAAEMPDVSFETIDIELMPEVADQHEIRSIPTVIIERDGVEVTTFVGIVPRNKYVEAINTAKG